MRILILSTPKTGNTWLLNLLSAIYDLPKLGLISPFDRAQADGLGSRWVLFHHLRPSAALLEWIAETRPVVLTTIRHPGDVLISLYHHVTGFKDDPIDASVLRSMLHQPFPHQNIDPPGDRTLSEDLACSIEWLQSGLAQSIRYEDLRLNTFEVLQALTNNIGQAPAWRIERAIERCDINLMRRLAGPHQAFFRAGRVGEWVDQLTPEVLEDLRTEPYRTQIAQLGYSLDEPQPSACEPTLAFKKHNPFGQVERFDNGAPVAPILMDLFLSLDPERTGKWTDIGSTAPGSFFEWVNAPSGHSEDGLFRRITLSNLATYIHRIRPDLHQAFRDLTGIARVLYVEWLVRNGPAEYSLDDSFLVKMRGDLSRWAEARLPESAAEWPWGSGPQKFLRPLGMSGPTFEANCWAFIDWVIANASELGTRGSWVRMARAAAERHRANGLFDADGEIARILGDARGLDHAAVQAFFAWLNAFCDVKGFGTYAELGITNLAWYCYRSRSDLIASFTELTGPSRADYVEWLVRNAGSDFGLDPQFVEGMKKQWLAWGTARAPEDPEILPSRPALTNYALHLYRSRADLQEAFPDVFGRHRWDYLHWFVGNAKTMNLEPELVVPIERRLGWLARIQPLGRAVAAVRRVARQYVARPPLAS